ncbi:MAG: hypothetical protein IKD04_09750 [Clostridia bacterium]|nr:hypothetical protein [Clostridia bacterium]
MKAKETVKGNKVPATLFVGVGGIGSRTIRKVSELAKKDDLSKSRFVILDTDVNDLQAADDNINITAIQTSSPRTIRDYLIQDDEARTEWFPNNMIINGKTVSEGAGQIRAISRLALNATIRQGRISALYDAIDALYLKDGSDKKQTVKVVVASTVAGGTGSGIAMIVAMLIRNYITKNYPESSAIIRGFFIMPGVMDCNKPSYSERKSMQRNGYATIKEINAFMMRPFFEAVPELRRYKNMHITVPTTAGANEKLSCLPYDFCFLFDRTDSDEFNMEKVAQYEDYVAHSIYEQCIGPMNRSASSKEDNVLKEFLDDRKLGRSRFGGAGASVVRYPYEAIRDYIALEWVEKRIIGHSGDAADEKARREMIENSWLVYDSEYWDKKKEFDQASTAGKREPNRGRIYTSKLETGTDEFSKMMNEDYIIPKNRKFLQKNSTSKALPAVENYISELVNRASNLYVSNANYTKTVKNFTKCKDVTPEGVSLKDRFATISAYEDIINIPAIRNIVKPFIESVFDGKEKMSKNAEPFMLESFLSIDGNAMHPNAMRYLLYKLRDQLASETETAPMDADFASEIEINKFGAWRKTGKGDNDENSKVRDVSVFQVFGGGKETGLQSMCVSCDEANLPVEGAKLKCAQLLTAYAGNLSSWYDKFFRYYVCLEARTYIDRLIEAFENFYDSFEKKIVGIEKKKKTILSSIEFNNGDCVLNLFGNPTLLKKLVSIQALPANGGQNDFKLNSGIYDAVKSNAKVGEKLKYDVLSDDTVQDVFDTVIIELYKEIVSDKCDQIIDVDILRAIALEHKMRCLCAADETTNELEKEELKARGNSYSEINAYVETIINKGRHLSSPCITRKDFDESREVDAIAYNKYLEEGEGVKMPRRFDAKNASDTVSKYELHFFRSIYDIMPTQLQKMCSPDMPVEELEHCIDAPASSEGVGEYFTAYQEYMTKIGPDNRLNPVITPHIDKRWNSISVLPEIDPRGYQRCLMKSIHQAMIYGFIYKFINKHLSSIHDAEKFVYRYKDGRNGFKKLIVSNHTKCDRLFEVLDALYFDRYAVRSIDTEATAIREKEFANSTLYEKTTFARSLDSLDRCEFIDEKDRLEIAKTKKEATSIFELPLLYWNSLPKKDAAELEVMVEAIFDILQGEIATFADTDDVNPIFAKLLVKHYKLLVANYEAFPKVFMGDNHIDVKSNDVIQTIEKKIYEKIVDLDVSETAEFSL